MKSLISFCPEKNVYYLQVISDAMGTRCFHYFWKNGSPSHNFFVVRNFSKMYIPLDFKFYLVSWIIKIFPVNFESFHCNKQYKKAAKTDPKLTLHHMGKNCISELTEIKFKIWRVSFFKSFLPLRNFGIDSFSWNNGNIECKALMRQAKNLRSSSPTNTQNSK